jgi:hypothetical protein
VTVGRHVKGPITRVDERFQRVSFTRHAALTRRLIQVARGRDAQTTNLGVRSLNLFGRAKSSTKIGDIFIL